MGRGGTAFAITNFSAERRANDLHELTDSSPEVGVLILVVLGKYCLPDL